MKTKIALALGMGLLTGIAGGVQAAGNEVRPGQPSAKQQLSRHAAVKKLVLKWGPTAAREQGVGIYRWADNMVPLFRGADLDNLNKALSSESYTDMVMTMTGSKKISAGKLPGGLTPLSLGSLTSDLVFTPLPSCLLVDTRVVGGAFSAATTRHFKASGANFLAQGGSNTNCGIPSGVNALVMTVQSVNATAKGYFRMWPYGTTMPAASVMSYGPTQNTQNNIVLATTVGETADFSVQSAASSHLVVAVLGYFAAPEATALQCTSVPDATPTVIGAGGVGNSTSAACPTGYTIVGGECNTTLTTTRIVDEDINTSSFNCEVFNGSGVVNETLSAVARCCRVPGR